MKMLMDAMRAGWQQYAGSGMYIGIFFVAMLFLWLVCYNKFSKEGKNGKRMLFYYALAITALVLFPGSAFLLLKYQTAFFTYSQLFLLIPMLPVMALAMTEFLTWVREHMSAHKDTPEWIKARPWICEAAALIVLSAVLCMAGSLSAANEVTGATRGSVKVPENVLQVFKTLETDEEINLGKDVIAAPDEVLEYARAYSGEFKLLYGRNMWQKELNAYTYDTYNGDLQKLHAWLNSTVYGLFGVDTEITVERALKIFKQGGGTVLILTKLQYAEEEIKGELAESELEVVAEAADYVILKK